VKLNRSVPVGGAHLGEINEAVANNLRRMFYSTSFTLTNLRGWGRFFYTMAGVSTLTVAPATFTWFKMGRVSMARVADRGVEPT